MPQLLLLNGAPALGKSTLARRYADDHPMTLCLDLDVLRSLLGGWAEDRHQAGLLARAGALGLARAHLRGGHSVIVPQLLGRVDFVLELEELARECDVPFIELVLVAPAEEAADRFRRRAEAPETPEQAAAAGGLHSGDVETEVEAMARGVEDVVARRPGTIPVQSVEGEIEATYQRLARAIERTGS